LILPVVICLSQRLSHACLSISFCTVKLRTAHYNSYNLFGVQFYMGTCGNSRANTCFFAWLCGKVVLISTRTNSSSAWLHHES